MVAGASSADRMAIGRATALEVPLVRRAHLRWNRLQALAVLVVSSVDRLAIGPVTVLKALPRVAEKEDGLQTQILRATSVEKLATSLAAALSELSVQLS